MQLSTSGVCVRVGNGITVWGLLTQEPLQLFIAPCAISTLIHALLQDLLPRLDLIVGAGAMGPVDAGGADIVAEGFAQFFCIRAA